MNSNFRNLALWAIIAVLLVALFNLFQSPVQRTGVQEVPYSKFLSDVENGTVRTVTIAGPQISGTYSDKGGRFETYAPEDPGLVARLQEKGIMIEARPQSEGSALGSFCVEGIGPRRLLDVSQGDLRKRMGEFMSLVETGGPVGLPE